MNYDDMPAGPELDRLVAEKVMGWEYSAAYNAYFLSDGKREREPSDWSPSTNIAHAWEVVEKLKEEWAVSLGTVGYKRDGVLMEWAVRCQMGDAIGPDAAAPTAPLAICRAVLKASLPTNRAGRDTP